MAESWTKISGTDNYEVKNEVVVRKVNKVDLLDEKTRLQADITARNARITKIDADVAQIDALEA